MIGPPPRTPRNWSPWRGLLPAVRAVVLGVYAVLASAGVVTSPTLSLALGVPCGVLGAALVASLHHGGVYAFLTLPHPLVAGIAVACLPAAAAGATAFGAGAGLLTALGVVLGAVVGGHWIAAPLRSADRAAAADRLEDEQ
jgi:hypothetical protein